MFFVFGTPRSGTTLLAQCLSAHSDVVVPYETDFIVPMAFVFDRVRDAALGRDLIARLIAGSEAFGRSLGEYAAAEDVRAAVLACEYHPHAILEAVYALVARGAGKRIAGDKSPNDLFFLRMLLKTGAVARETKVLHIVRDIRDVMPSVNETGWAAELDLYFPRYWCAHNLYLHAFLSREPDRYLLVRYEDLVADPEEWLGRCCALLGVPFEEGMLSPERRHARYRNMPELRSVYEPIGTGRVGRHRGRLPAETLRSYEAQAREALVAFGYLEP